MYYCMYYKKNIFGARDAYASRAPSLVVGVGVVVVVVAAGGCDVEVVAIYLYTSSWTRFDASCGRCRE